MGHDFHTSATVKARKQHRCEHCRAPILPGQTHHHTGDTQMTDKIEEIERLRVALKNASNALRKSEDEFLYLQKRIEAADRLADQVQVMRLSPVGVTCDVADAYRAYRAAEGGE